MTLFPVSQIVLYAVVAGAGTAGALAVWPWARRGLRFVVAGTATAAGFVVWNLTLNATHASGFNTEQPCAFAERRAAVCRQREHQRHSSF